jgi:hypothetical protein
MQKEGLSRGSKQTFFLLLCLKDGFASRHRYLKRHVSDQISRFRAGCLKKRVYSNQWIIIKNDNKNYHFLFFINILE